MRSKGVELVAWAGVGLFVFALAGVPLALYLRTTGKPAPENPRGAVTGATVDRATVGPLTVIAAPYGVSRESGGYQFVVGVFTTDDTKSVPFRPWSANTSLAKATDELGNTYRCGGVYVGRGWYMTLLSIERDAVPHLKDFWKRLPKEIEEPPVSINSRRGSGDVLEIDALAPAAKRILISLSAECVGGTGWIGFEFGVEDVRRIAPPGG